MLGICNSIPVNVFRTKSGGIVFQSVCSVILRKGLNLAIFSGNHYCCTIPCNCDICSAEYRDDDDDETEDRVDDAEEDNDKDDNDDEDDNRDDDNDDDDVDDDDDDDKEDDDDDFFCYIQTSNKLD